MARIPYPAKPDPAVFDLPAPLNAFRMISHAAPLTRPTVELGLAILARTTLPPALREQVILAVAAACECAYERAQHIPIALDSGVTAAQVAALASGHLDPSIFSTTELATVTAAHELVVRHTWQAATVDTLHTFLTAEQVVELLVIVGYYTMLAGLMNALDVDIDPSGERFATIANRHQFRV